MSTKDISEFISNALFVTQACPGLSSDSSPLQTPQDSPTTLQDPQKRDTGLYERQQTCGVGRHECDTGGCCSGPCCGNGCCPLTYTCHIVGNTPGCCPLGRTCNDEISGCTSANLVECQGFDHCCPVGQACSLDAIGNAQCGGQPAPGGGGAGNGNGNGGNNPSSSISDPEPGPSDTSETVNSTPTEGTPEIERSLPPAATPTTPTTTPSNGSPTSTTRAPSSVPVTIAGSGSLGLAVNGLGLACMMGMVATLIL